MDQFPTKQFQWKVQQNPKELDLSYCIFLQDEDFIQYLKSPKSAMLLSLNLSHTLLSDHAILELSCLKTKTIKHLDLSYCVNFTEGAIVNLLHAESMSNIEQLNLSGNQLSDVCLKFLFQPNKMKYLADISLNDIKKGQQGFTYKAFEMLSQTNLGKSLLSLSMGNSFVSTDQIQISKAQTIMNSFFNRIIKEDHTYFYQLSLKSTSIEKLILYKCDLLTNRFIKMLCLNVAFFSSIKVLNIGNCKLLTDKSLHYLSEAGISVQKLSDLDLLGLNITSQGLEKLMKSKSLKLSHLGLAMCDDIQADSIKSLMESKFGKNLLSLEISGSKEPKSQIVGLFSNEQIIWKDFNMKTIFIELYCDKECYYQSVGKQQIQFQQEQLVQQNCNMLDPYYKGFFQTYMYKIMEQIIFIKKIKIIIKVIKTDEELIAQYLTNFIEQNNLLDELVVNDNNLFINDVCILSYVLQQITKTSAKQIDVDQQTKIYQEISIIQMNYIDPIQKEKLNVSQIRNLVLIKQDALKDSDLEIIGNYSDSIFQQLCYLQIKGCKQITFKGLYNLKEKLMHQIQFLDIRNTRVQFENYPQLLTDFPNLTSFNNNKIFLQFTNQNTKEDLISWLNFLFRLMQLKNLKIRNTNKKSIFNMFLLRFVAQMIKNNHLSMKKLDMQLYLNITDCLIYQEESLTELQESLQLSFNISTLYLEISGLIKHQLIIDIINTINNTQIKNLNIQLENCNIIDEVIQSKQNSTHNFHCLEIKINQINLLDRLLYQTGSLDQLICTITLSNNQNLEGLLNFLNTKQLQVIDLELIEYKNEQLLDILSSINGEKLKDINFKFNNFQLNEIILTKLQEILIKSKLLLSCQIEIIGCGCTTQQIEKYFKGNLQVLKIPHLKIYY